MTSGPPPPPWPGPSGPQGWPPPGPFPAAPGWYPPGVHPAYPPYGDAYPAYPSYPGAYPAQPGPYPVAPPGPYPVASPGGGVGQPGPYPAAPPPDPVDRSVRWRKALPAIVIAVSLAAAGGAYTIYRNDHRTSAAQAVDCEVPGARLVTLPKKSPTEPTITIPLTAGWNEVDLANANWLGNRRTNMRGYFVNDSIRQSDYSPDLAVEIGVTSEAGEAAAKRILRSNPEITRTQIVDEDGCGTTLYRTDFSQLDRFRPGTAPISGTTIIEVLADSNGTKHVVTLNLGTKNPDNSSYIAQRDAVLKGLQVSVS